MKRICRKGLALLTTLAFLFAWAIPAYAAGDTWQVQYDVQYDQTGARAMLKMVNDFRTGEEAWYWNKDDTQKVQAEGLEPLQYDYALEKVAMQRAAEAAIRFSHTRPDGTSCETAYNEVGNFGLKAENIAAGTASARAEDAFDQWKEDGLSYAGQGHRRNMLSSLATTFAVAHVVYQGVDFWVQEFSNTPVNLTETEPNNGTTTVTVDVSNSQLASKTVDQPTAITLALGDTADLPLVDASMNWGEETWETNPKVKAQASWQTDGKGIVEVQDGKITALQAGTTMLTGTVLGETVSLPVTVQPLSLKGATVTLEDTEYGVTDQPIQPAVTVTLNGKMLTQGIDYTVAYTNNTDVGTATVTVTGIGNYTDTVQTSFTITACNHQWGEGTVTKAATCTEEGVKTYTCSLCGATKDETIAKVPHTSVTVEGKAATCTETGLTDSTKCSVCGEILTAPTEIPALGHTWGEWKTVNTAGCTAEGSERRSCEVCGTFETRNVSATGHTWATEVTVDKPATCTTDGSQSIHCTKCDATKDSQVIPALGHSWGDGEVTTPATCTEDGVRTYTCSRCQEEKTDPIPATGHTWGEWETTKEATCTEAGVRSHTCSKCNTTETETIEALGHDWGDGEITTPATCTEDGVRTYTCSRCDEEKTDPIPATGHTEETIPGKAATCTETGLTDEIKCSVCGEILIAQTEIPALGHDWGEGEITTPATCTKEGIKTYTCSRCKEEKTETIPATGHSFETTWSSDATSHWHACTACDARKDEAKHTMEWVVDQDVTGTQAGKQHEECTVCHRWGAVAMPVIVDGEEDNTDYRVKQVEKKPEEGEKNAMDTAVSNKLPAGTETQKTFFYELTLQSQVNSGAWNDVDASDKKITVTIPYPTGTNGTSHDFIVTHYTHANEVEQPAVTETAEGLQVTLQGLSPVAVTAYTVKPVTPPSQTESGSGQTQPTQQTQQTSNPQPTATPAPAAVASTTPAPAAAQPAAPQSSIPATSDSMPLVPLIVLCVVAVCGLVILVIVKHRRNK